MNRTDSVRHLDKQVDNVSHLDKQGDASSCKPSKCGGAKNNCEEEEEVGGGEGGEVVETKTKAHRGQGCSHSLKRSVH